MISKEAKRAYDRRRYWAGKKQVIFEERKCRTCHILLRSKEGAYRTRSYCRSCRRNGVAKKHLNTHMKHLYYVKNRALILQKVKARAELKKVA